MEWSNEKVLELIDAYRDLPVLWDCTLPDYKNRNKRSDALNRIATLLGIEKVEVERKIKNLLSLLLREVKKGKESVKSGSGTDSVHKSKWFDYGRMMFLLDRNKVRNTKDTQVNDEEIPPEEAAEEEKESQDDGEQTDTTTGGIDKSTNISFQKPNANYARGRQFNTPILKEAVSVIKDIQANRKQVRDECSVFGEHVANKIRKITNPRAQAMVQHLICNTLFEAEMGKFDQPPIMYGQHRIPQYPAHNDCYRPPSSSSSSGSPYDGPPSTSGLPTRWQMSQLSPAMPSTPSDTGSIYTEEGTEEMDRILASL